MSELSEEPLNKASKRKLIDIVCTQRVELMSKDKIIEELKIRNEQASLSFQQVLTLIFDKLQPTSTDKVEGNGPMTKVNVSVALNGVNERGIRDEEREYLARRDEPKRRMPEQVHRAPLAPELWWKSWLAISLWSALGAGALALLLMQIENTTARIVIGIIAAVFVMMITQNPTLRFRRWCLMTLTGWLGANALGFIIRGQLVDDTTKAKIHWDGSVHWSFNATVAVAVIVTGFLAWHEWKQETQG